MTSTDPLDFTCGTMRVQLHEPDSAGRDCHLVWTGPLADFARDNELDPETVCDIIDCLQDVGQYCGGGGAAPEYRLVLCPE